MMTGSGWVFGWVIFRLFERAFFSDTVKGQNGKREKRAALVIYI